MLDLFERAYYELLPMLLEKGHNGKILVFGYGRAWFSVGETERSAMANLMRKYPDQRPKVYGQIKSEDLISPFAKEYYAWKADKERNREPNGSENVPG